MSQTGIVAWSQTAASNATADSTVNFAEGMAPSAVNNSARALMASAAKYRDDTSGSLVTGGTTTAYTLDTNQVFSDLSVLDGQELTVRFDQANGASATLNVDTLGAKALKINATDAVPEGMIAADSIWRITYDNSIPAFIVNGVAAIVAGASADITGDAAIGGDLAINTDKFTVDGSTGDVAAAGDLDVTGGASAATLTVNEGSAPSTPASGKGIFYEDTNGLAHFKNDGGTDLILSAFGGQLIHLRDSKTSGTDGGSISSGSYGTRELTTAVVNQISGSSLSSNQVTLPAGTYVFLAFLTVHNNATGGRTVKSRLYNITDSSLVLLGPSAGLLDVNRGVMFQFGGRFSLSGSKAIALQMQASGVTVIAGQAASFGDDEIYADLMIWKIA